MNQIIKIKNSVAYLLRTAAGHIYRYLTLKLCYPNIYIKEMQKPVKEKAVFLERRGEGITDNFARVYQQMKKEGVCELVTCYIQEDKPSYIKRSRNSVSAVREIATAKYVFINDSSSLISCLPLRKETNVIQLWHACGAFKKFGYSTVDKIFGGNRKELETYPMHKNFSLVTVSSPSVVWAYAEAFHMEDRKEHIVPVGISRTDVFFDQGAIRQAYEKVYNMIPVAKEKKIILYAPTFRGRMAEAFSPDEMDLKRMKEVLGEEYILLIKHHPFVKKTPIIRETEKDFALDVTKFLTIEELLMVSDICISDYSSLIFEYSLFERPMIFFAYDLDEYFDWRGFYYPYEEMTPGPVCKNIEEVLDYIINLDSLFDRQKVIDFKEKFMSACDGHATERILELVKTGFEKNLRY